MTETAMPTGHLPTRIPLRERKKLRTREVLVSSALEMFTESGFDETTLDDLCDAAEVSKRTFFRYFASKEDCALAPTQDFWRAFLDEIETRPASAAPLLDVVQQAVFAAADRMAGDEWARRVRLSRRLAAVTSSMNSHGLGFCDRAVASAMCTLTADAGIDGPDLLPARLVLEFSAATVRCALEAWAALPGTPGHERLVSELQIAFSAMPRALTVAERPGRARSV